MVKHFYYAKETTGGYMLLPNKWWFFISLPFYSLQPFFIGMVYWNANGIYEKELQISYPITFHEKVGCCPLKSEGHVWISTLGQCHRNNSAFE